MNREKKTVGSERWVPLADAAKSPWVGEVPSLRPIEEGRWGVK